MLGSESWGRERLLIHERRGETVGKRLSRLIALHSTDPTLGLDVGSGDGMVTRILERETGFGFISLEPHLQQSDSRSRESHIRGTMYRLPFRGPTFDVVTLISVYEHIPTSGERTALLKELSRVLKPGGVLVGQMPNMNYPVEMHSLLPFQQFLPKRVAKIYFTKLSPVPRETKERLGIYWYRVTPLHLKKEAKVAGFGPGEVIGVNMPREVIPSAYRWATPLLHLLPMNWDFYFQKVSK